MFSTFTTQAGYTLIIRALDIRSFENGVSADSCTMIWEPTPGQLMDRDIRGTAEDNMDRLRQEETDALIAAEKIRQQQARQPIERGRQSLRMRS